MRIAWVKMVPSSSIFSPSLSDSALSWVTSNGLPALGLCEWSWSKANRGRLVLDNRSTPSPQEITEVVEVHYATHRERTAAADVSRYYGGRRGPLQFGRATVIVRPNRDLQRLPGISAWRLQRRSRWTENPYLQTLIPEDRLSFYQQIEAALARSERRELLLFVHGYYVSFRAAAEALGALAVDLDLDGAPLLYSWPSQANLISYFVDRNNLIHDHVMALAEILASICAIERIGEITIVAHSMGNQFLLSALEVAQREMGVKASFARSLIFASPDVDRADFVARAPGLTGLAERSTLYASRRDRALWLSAKLQAYDRAGNSAQPVIVKRLDTIATSDVSEGAIGHADFAATALDDLRSHVWFSLAPSERRAILMEANAPDGPYWGMSEEGDDRRAFGMALILCRRLGDEAPAFVDQLLEAAPRANHVDPIRTGKDQRWFFHG